VLEHDIDEALPSPLRPDGVEEIAVDLLKLFVDERSGANHERRKVEVRAPHV
jgi:hypothetical protein